MWWRVKFLVVVLGCVANFVLAQQHQDAGGGGVPLPSLPPQAPSLNSGGVPLPSPGGSNLPPLVVPLDHAGGVPLPPISAHETVVVPLDHDGDIKLTLPIGGAAGVPLPPSFGGSARTPTGVPLPTLGGGKVPPAGVLGGAGAPGGLRHVHNPHQDTTIQRVLGLAAVRANLQLKTRADKAVKISDVITAHKQVVSGQLVYLTLRVGETECSIGSPDVSRCPFDHDEDSYVCEIVVWERPWLNSSKVIEEKSRCAETEDDNDFYSWGFRNSFHYSEGETMLQALPNHINEQQVALEAFNYLDRASDSKFRGEKINHNIASIKFYPIENMTKVKINIEYGFKLCLKSPDMKTDPRVCPLDIQRDHYVCSVYVVHNPNQIAPLEVIPILEDDDHEVHCERKRSVDEELVVPVRAPCLGCPQPASLNDPTIMEIADFALKEYDRRDDDDELHMIVQLVKAQTQVGAGVKYYLTLELAETDCKKTFTGVDVNRTFCNQDIREETKICNLHIVDQPWVPSRDLVAAQCYDRDNYPTSTEDEFIVPVALGTNFAAFPSASTGFQSRTASSFGNQKNLQIDANIMGLAQMVVTEYNRREDDPEYYKFLKVHEATAQGKIYRLAVEMGETNCHKFDPNLGNGQHCIVNPREEHEVCKAEIHEQAPNNRVIVSMECDDLDDYFRDHLMPTLSSFDVMDHPFLNGAQGQTGGTPVPTNSPQVQEIASFIVDQHNLRSDEDELYVLTNIVSAQSMNAGGMTKYLMEVEAAETHCKKYLLIADPRRCLIDHTEEREICQAEVVVSNNPSQPKQLTKLYCDERNDYYTNKLRGKVFGINPYSTSASQVTGTWTAANLNDTSVRKLGHLIADEFDFRSDEDNLFIFHKVLKAQKQVTSGLKYHMIVELVETVCPKYKRRINKNRCVPDIGEDHMICTADVLIQPWLSKQQVMNLHCTEKDDFRENDASHEVLLPRVHPSAHARPVFKSHFLIRTSVESEESNERFYHADGRLNRRHDSEEDDSDELPIFRGKRQVLAGGYSAVDKPSDPKYQEIANFALKSIDGLSTDTRLRAVETINSVSEQVVAGKNYKLNVSIYWTTCLKADELEDTSSCTKDSSEPSVNCEIIVYDIPWQSKRSVSSHTCDAQ